MELSVPIRCVREGEEEAFSKIRISGPLENGIRCGENGSAADVRSSCEVWVLRREYAICKCICAPFLGCDVVQFGLYCSVECCCRFIAFFRRTGGRGKG